MPLDQENGPVKIYSPTSAQGVWQVTWTPPGMLRQVKQRKTKEKALELAKEIRGLSRKFWIGVALTLPETHTKKMLSFS